jgi:hypothetical protein
MEKNSSYPLKEEKDVPCHLEALSEGHETERDEIPGVDPDFEKRLLRKLDLRIVPILWLMFLLAFLDRTNVCLFCSEVPFDSRCADRGSQIGNAKIQGMTEDLNMTGDDYNVALLSFFITYILFEVPSNIVSQSTTV